MKALLAKYSDEVWNSLKMDTFNTSFLKKRSC